MDGKQFRATDWWSIKRGMTTAYLPETRVTRKGKVAPQKEKRRTHVRFPGKQAVLMSNFCWKHRHKNDKCTETDSPPACFLTKTTLQHTSCSQRMGKIKRGVEENYPKHSRSKE